MKRLLFLLPICFFIVDTLSGQENLREGREVYAPFVSNLEVVPDENRIVLSWNDSPDTIDIYRIYRSSKPFSREGETGEVLIGSVPAGKQSYSYYPDSTEAFYYAVLGMDANQREYRLFIPFRNISSEAVSVSSIAGIEERATVITGLEFRVSGELVYLSYKSSKPDRSVLVYRGTSPIVDEASLREAGLVSSLNRSGGRVTDFPLPGLDYYYAILDGELAAKGLISLIPGENSTEEPASIRLPSTYSALTGEERSSRIRPLPFLTLPRSVSSGDYLSDYEKHTLPPFRALSEAADGAVKALLASLPAAQLPPMPKPVVLAQERSPGEDPEALLLYDLVNESFIEERWEMSERDLGSFLAVRRSKQLEARGHFYMGQAYFFQEKYRQAFMEFLFAREIFDSESQAWIDAVLQRIGT